LQSLIIVACIGASLYYFYLMTNFLDAKASIKQEKRKKAADKMLLQMYGFKRRRK